MSNDLYYCYIVYSAHTKKQTELTMRNLIFIISLALLQGCLSSSSSSVSAPSDNEGSQTPPATEESPGSGEVVQNPPPATETPPATEEQASSCDGVDCNYCANDVEQQFNDAKDKLHWSSLSWEFNWPQPYPPNGVTPKDIFDGAESDAHEFNIPDKHIQGFTRTNSARFPYAGSHSHSSGTQGGVFVIENNGGKLSLSSLHKTDASHPSGVHILGKELVYADKVGQKLMLMDIDSPNQSQKRSFTIEQPLFGGGLGIAKTDEGKYLLITTGPGGQQSGPRYNHFYELSATGLVFLGSSEVAIPSDWDGKFIFSENLSVLSECDTGAIYTVHSTGDESGLGIINGNGYWRLSKMEKTNDEYKLVAINKFKTAQDISDCSIRAVGMVTVNPEHQLEFYCHGYAKEPDGASIPFFGDVLGPPRDKNKDSDNFFFKRGAL